MVSSFYGGFPPGGGGISLEETLTSASWSLDITSGTGLLTFTGQPLDGETVTIGGKTYTFRTVIGDVDCDVFIGSDLEESIQNLINAINGGPGSGTAYADECTVHPTMVASLGEGTSIIVEELPGGLVGDPPLVTSVGKLPTELSGTPTLNGWWRADQRVGILPGTTEVHVQGNLSPTLIGLDPDFENVLFGEPSFKKTESALNNQEAIIYGAGVGVGSYMHTKEASMPLPVHLFVVVKEDTFVLNSRFVGERQGSDNLQVVRSPTSTTLEMINTAASGWVNSITRPSAGTGFLMEAFFDGLTTSFMRIDAGAKTTGGASGQATDGITIAAGGGGSNPSQITVAEIIRFDGELTGTDLTDLLAYIKDRYNITAIP